MDVGSKNTKGKGRSWRDTLRFRSRYYRPDGSVSSVAREPRALGVPATHAAVLARNSGKRLGTFGTLVDQFGHVSIYNTQ